MAFPVTLNGRTYTLTDFEGTNYVDGLPDAFEDFVTHAGDIYNSTSTTSNSIGTGSKTFTVEANKPYQAGTPLRIADAAAPSTNFLDTVVTSYSGTTLVVNSIGFGGSGTKTSWTVNIGGAKTVDGTLGLSQGGTGATDAAGARTNIDVYSKSEADTRYLNISGDSADISFGANMSFGDNNKAIFGAGSDLQIYHDGSHSYVTDQGTGRLYLQGTSNVTFTNADGTAEYANFANGGAVSLRYNNGVKLATSSIGVSVAGALDLSAATGSGTLNIISTVNAVDAGNKIAFFGANRSDTDEEMAYIKPLLLSNSGGSGNVQEGHLTFGTSGNEAMRLDSDGKFFVGKDTDDQTTPGLAVNGNGLTKIVRASATANVNDVLQLNRLTTDGDILVFKKDGTEMGSAGTTSSDLYIGTGDTTIRFADGVDGVLPTGTNGAQRDGAVNLGAASNRFQHLFLSGGVYLGGTGSANHLDYYEEGSFTPTVADALSGGNTSPSYSTRVGFYTRVGRNVNIQIHVTNISTSGLTLSNDLFVQGLPFPSSSTSTRQATGTMRVDRVNVESTCFGVVPILGSGRSTVQIYQNRDNTTDISVQVGDILSGQGDMFISINYDT